ncbi:hypothetical protein [Halopiger goleimassiliensis]|nr:hypothetical protein [Halopiger goleimassiliensis]
MATIQPKRRRPTRRASASRRAATGGSLAFGTGLTAEVAAEPADGTEAN